MSDYREECIRRKNVQRGIEEERPVSGRKQAGAKPFLIESFCFGRWGWNGRYTNRKAAEQAFERQSRKHPSWGWRLLEDGEVIREYTPEVSDASQ